MQKKIIEHGTSGAVVVPKKWMDKYDLKKGDTLELEEIGPKLTLSIEKIGPLKESIKLQQNPFIPYVHRVIGKVFQAGYDHIEVEVSDRADMDKAETEALSNVMGLEIIKKTETKVIYDVVIADTLEQYEKYEIKIFQTAIEYAKYILELIENKDYTKLDNQNIEMLNNKFSIFCQRYINKELTKGSPFTYVVLWNLEKITDEYKYLAHFVKEHKVKISKETIEYFQKSIKYLEDFYSLFYKFDLEKYSKMYKNKNALVSEGYDLGLKKPNSEAIAISHIRSVIVGIFDCLGNVLAKNLPLTQVI